MDESETRRDILEKKKLTEILSENNFLFFFKFKFYQVLILAI